MIFPNAQSNSAVLKRDTAVSTEMSNAIDSWMNLYIGQAPWLANNKQSMKLPASIASEMARMVTLEMKVEISGSERADYLKKQIAPVLNKIRKYCEYACAGGGLMFKPYYDNNGLAIDVVQATDFYPISFNSSDKLISCIFVEHKTHGDKFYHRLETHEFINGKYVVTNQAYESNTMADVGKEISLASVVEWSNLQPVVTLENITAPLFAYFKIPFGNTIDPTSPLGVSVYARAVDLIQDADEQYQRFLWEFKGGELAIDVARDALKMDAKGNPIYPEGKERLFRTNELDSAGNSGENLKTFSPTLRDASLINGLNTILQKIEFNTGLAYGTLSDPQNIDKTATEIKISKQRTYASVTDIQKALQTAFEDLIYAMDIYATLYKLAAPGKINTAYEWDDSIVVDAEAERIRDMQEVKSGLLPKWKYIMKWQGLDEETAKAQVDEMNNNSASQNPFNLS